MSIFRGKLLLLSPANPVSSKGSKGSKVRGTTPKLLAKCLKAKTSMLRCGCILGVKWRKDYEQKPSHVEEKSLGKQFL